MKQKQNFVIPFVAQVAKPMIKKGEVDENYSYHDRLFQGSIDDRDNGMNTFTDDPG